MCCTFLEKKRQDDYENHKRENRYEENGNITKYGQVVCSVSILARATVSDMGMWCLTLLHLSILTLNRTQVHPAFTDQFLDAHIANLSRINKRDTPAQQMRALASSLEFVARLLDVSLEAFDKSLGSVWKLPAVIRFASHLAEVFPVLQDDVGALNQFLAGQFMPRIMRMQAGELLLCPAGWCDSPTTGGVILLVLQRKKNSWSLSVCNVSNGSEFHSAAIDASTGAVRRQVVFDIDNIPSPRLQDSAFWFLLFRMMIRPDPDNGPLFLYTKLLPALNTRPIQANFVPYSAKSGKYVVFFVSIYGVA